MYHLNRVTVQIEPRSSCLCWHPILSFELWLNLFANFAWLGLYFVTWPKTLIQVASNDYSKLIYSTLVFTSFFFPCELGWVLHLDVWCVYILFSLPRAQRCLVDLSGFCRDVCCSYTWKENSLDVRNETKK